MTEHLNSFKEDNFQLVCNKENMIFKTNKDDNIFILDFELINKNFDLNQLMILKYMNLFNN